MSGRSSWTRNTAPFRRRRGCGSALHLTLTATILAVLIAGCGGKQRLAQYDFRHRSLAVVSIAPAHPEVLTSVSVRTREGDSTPLALARVGTELAREATAHQVRPKLDAAARNVDVSARMAERTLHGASRHLRTTPAESPIGADFELEIRVRRYGIVASSWHANAYFRIDADLILLDGATGRRIWRTRVQRSDPIGPTILAVPDRAVSSAITAIMLATMSQSEIERTLELLADYAADVMVDRLVRGLDRARG